MPQIKPDSVLAIQPELISGENILWAGQPSPRVIFHREDVYLIPFSLVWGGFSIFWEALATGFWSPGKTAAAPPAFLPLFGLAFVVMGQYLIWGRFFYAAWKKKRTHYAVTNRRVIVVQDGITRHMAAAYVDTLPTLAKEGSPRFGTLRFAESPSIWASGSGWRAWDPMAIATVPIFRDIQDLDLVYRLVSGLRTKSHQPA